MDETAPNARSLGGRDDGERCQDRGERRLGRSDQAESCEEHVSDDSPFFLSYERKQRLGSGIGQQALNEFGFLALTKGKPVDLEKDGAVLGGGFSEVHQQRCRLCCLTCSRAQSCAPNQLRLQIAPLTG